MMTFGLGQLAGIILGYLSVLFLTATAVDRSWIPKRWVQQPIVYIFSLGVYASTWAFYGSVSLADQFGYGFLAYYLGISGAFVMTPILLRPLLKIITRYQLSSLADLLAFRYRSRTAGVLVAVFMLTISIPLLTLQISAIGDTLSLLNNEWPITKLALGYCLTMILFAALFGTRHVSTREKHEGLVFAIAVETLIKLVALVTLALVIVFGVFNDVGGVSNWLATNADVINRSQDRMDDGAWRVLLLLFFAAAIVLPHMYHMAFTENNNPSALRQASWGFPVLLFVMALCVPPILWAGDLLEINTSAEYFALAIGLKLESPTLTILVFLGGVAAASGIVIVTTLATASMFLNQLVLPLYQPNPRHNFYGWLIWIRRILIAAILLAAYGFYRILGEDINHSHLGILAFVAAGQFLPGLAGLLYWPKANKIGFIVGLVAGFSVWAVLMLVPLGQSMFSMEVFSFLTIPDESNWHYAAIASLTANFTLFVLVSLLTKMSRSEQAASEICSIDTVSRSNRLRLVATDSHQVTTALSRPLGKYVAEREVQQALLDLALSDYEDRPSALRQLREQLEVNLSGLMGPTVSHSIIRQYLPLREEYEVSSDIFQMEQRLEGYHNRLDGIAGELDELRRYHRQTLERLPLGVCSLAPDGEVVLWNQAMAAMTGIASTAVSGAHVSQLPSPWGQLLEQFKDGSKLHRYKTRIDHGARPTWYSLHKSMMPASSDQLGGVVILVEDLTDTQMLENKLIHSERLASIGRLAAGVAHEIGNPITGIDCLAQDLRYEATSPELKKMADQIQQQTHRVSNIVQSLVNFAHAGDHSNTNDVVDIHDCVNQAIQLLQLDKRQKEVEFRNQCQPDATVYGDGQRLVQVFVNLLDNARDASESGQCIDIETEYQQQQLKIKVTDHGHGMQPDTIERVFEPFFTTKEVGDGTGLGLALVYSIVEQHYGQISVDSPVVNDLGTCITVTLPRAAANAEVTNL